VTTVRILAVVAGAALIGLAGGYLTLAVTRIWVDNVVGGRGWIAIALVIFARWHPWRALVGALLFGCIEALIPRLAAAGVDVPRYLLLMTPYLVTLLVMVWTASRLRDRSAQPAALGIHHIREERT
jgi:simple sugar transport system permease protein